MTASRPGALRAAIRRLRKSWLFSLSVILVLTVAETVSTSTFMAFDAVALRPIAARHPEALRRPMRVLASGASGAERFAFTAVEMQELREAVGAPVLATSEPRPASEKGLGPLMVSFASPNTFDMLGVRAMRGRLTLEIEPRRVPTVIISHHLWKTRLRSDTTVIGKWLVINDVKLRVGGVLPESFRGTGPSLVLPDAWMSVNAMGRVLGMDEGSGERLFALLVRVPDDASSQSIEAAMTSMARWFPRDAEANDEVIGMSLAPAVLIGGTEAMPIRSVGVILLVLLALPTLLVSSRIARRILVRMDDRRRDVALQRAMGASKRTLVWQLSLDSLVLSAVSSIGSLASSVAVYHWGYPWVLLQVRERIGLDGVNFAVAPGVSAHVLLFTASTCALGTLLFGVRPALTFVRQMPVLMRGGVYTPSPPTPVPAAVAAAGPR